MTENQPQYKLIVTHSLLLDPEYGDMVMGWDFTWDDEQEIASLRNEQDLPSNQPDTDMQSANSQLQTQSGTASTETKMETNSEDVNDEKASNQKDDQSKSDKTVDQTESGKNIDQTKAIKPVDSVAFKEQVERRSVFFDLVYRRQYMLRLVDEFTKNSKTGRISEPSFFLALLSIL